MINTNYESILKYVYENDSSLEGIIKGLENASIDTKLNAVRFVIELFNSSKQLQSEGKEQFFTQLIKEKLFALLVDILTYNERVLDFKEDRTSDESQVKEVVQTVVDTVVKLNGNRESEIDLEYNVGKVDLLKVYVAEILTNCFQILPSKVMRCYINF
eukprot:TRINITY_DN9893_c0_g1_i14.p1 TRINITY_DN9893_c0_g1~~TRINITY_DN9893_c0_g1_i14.p1  ORF type:complete len:158 (+),score=56.89 TRINITY_DN9893_c0_g1_i14:1324-1797(+)